MYLNNPYTRMDASHNIFVFVSSMKTEQLGSAMIHKYVKNDENNLILPSQSLFLN